MKYLKKFENNSSYEEYILSEDSILPNVSYTVDTNEVFYNPLISNPSLYEWVDLGLPSGLKWADRNVGANAPEDFGLYFAWGETEGYEGITDTKKFTWSDYKLCGGSNSTLTKYIINSYDGTVDSKYVLEQVDDAVYVSNNTCRMPTKADFEELRDNTTSTWETLNGVKGRRFTSKVNGNSIFVPAAGYYGSGSAGNVGVQGGLWSSSISETNSCNAYILNFYLVDGAELAGIYTRCTGFPVRAVKE